jgi:polyisoprenoid-binding protein YceI
MRVSLLVVSLSASFASAAEWRFDSKQSELAVKIWKTGLGSGLAHDHVVRAQSFSGQATLNEAKDYQTLAFTVSVDAASLIPDEPAARQRHAVSGTVPESDRLKVRENMLGTEQLDVARFPNIVFKSTELALRPDTLKVIFKGSFELHGVTQTLEFPVSLKRSPDRIEGHANIRLKTSDYGITPYSAAMGLIKNKDEIELVLHLVLVPAA